ncbi:MAG: hypothetical protein IT326_09060 [Anaerolineae bacterium]|nr:hypothetical protein [Anaerolineae bacterium]
MARWFPDAKISRIHGQPRPFGSYLVVPFFHPAVALYRADMRPVLEADFARLPQWIEQAKALVPRGAPPPPAPPDAPDSFQQLSLF